MMIMAIITTGHCLCAGYCSVYSPCNNHLILMVRHLPSAWPAFGSLQALHKYDYSTYKKKGVPLFYPTFNLEKKKKAGGGVRGERKRERQKSW